MLVRIFIAYFLHQDASANISQRDGIEAVGKVNSKPDHYDLIFMDIIMPQLDGVSATAMIRQVREIPIIAMTSNINQQDLDTYSHWGKWSMPCRVCLAR